MISDERFGLYELSDWFWDIVQRADKDHAKLEGILKDLSNDLLYCFALEYLHASSLLRREPYIDHFYVGQSKSEDVIASMTSWVVSQGKEFYMTVWYHPEAVLAYEDASLAHEFGFEGIAEGIIEERLGEWPEIMEEYGDFLDSAYARVSDYCAARQA